ncbi:GvpL/GvpF family gas vesicle protein [Frankia sp. AgB1.9]|uniref:GvpL/GvpF family gas vesicle protein n=1 Tax=unclassified Frankia TaxID=2632575 RepID=UPI001933E669|nr:MULTISPECIES: GvpL/GvpF family gas vesicle protein [unclassified Frankia]MBL7494236.1 GvpL/GvpF family gas vesicle protein [Frankia sp. AgW1.1]MBL7552457.1 GvpL/GvpF family gas vesicle protein [Frankia sp. AgB1.9]MBL7623559.1 GvpL/GvpF family gas vesicle protein [Frankia sp. AgB1.8]
MRPATGAAGELAARLAPDVLDEAVADARAQARSRLAAALADEIVTAALDADTDLGRPPPRNQAPAATRPIRPARARPLSTEPVSPAEPVTPARPSAAATGTSVAGSQAAGTADRTGLYAYGITDAAAATDDIVGLDDQTPVETIRVGQAALVTSTIDLDMLAGLEQEVSETGQLSESGRLADLASRHDRVMRLLLDRGPVLPLRFGTVLPDRPRAERLLRLSEGELAAELDHVRDHREWGLRVTPPDKHDAREQAQDTPDAGPATTEEASGTAYLSARRDDLRSAALREEHLTGLTRRIHDELAALASDVEMRSGRPGAGRLNAAYLVGRAAEDDFLDAAATATRELADAGCEGRLTGPWPPYSFVRLTLGEASHD